MGAVPYSGGAELDALHVPFDIDILHSTVFSSLSSLLLLLLCAADVIVYSRRSTSNGLVLHSENCTSSFKFRERTTDEKLDSKKRDVFQMNDNLVMRTWQGSKKLGGAAYWPCALSPSSVPLLPHAQIELSHGALCSQQPAAA